MFRARPASLSLRDIWLMVFGAIAVGLSGSLLAAEAGASAPRPSTPRPNIVLMMADDLGYGQLGYEGNREVKTPRLDALAAEALWLTHCYAPHSLCAPTRSAIMAGRNSYRVGGTGGLGGNLSPAETTLTRLRQNLWVGLGHKRR